MASVPRDSAFWRRFSTAVHRDEKGSSTAKASRAYALERQDSWLAREERKNRRNRILMIVSGVTFVLVVAVIVLVLIYLNHHGWYLHGEKFAFP